MTPWNSKRSNGNNNDNEFMPVTKKMNYLSIRNSDSASSGNSSSFTDDIDDNSGYRYSLTSSTNGQNNANNDLMYLNEIYRTYNPSLKLKDNPIYFHANQILFEAHRMRIMRTHETLLKEQQQKNKLLINDNGNNLQQPK